MSQARLALYQVLITGPLLAAVVVAFLLTRKRILAYIRRSSWLAVIGWWLLGVLPWVVATQFESFLILGTNWFTRVLVSLFALVAPFIIFALPFFALGGTGVWTQSRVGKVRGPNVTARGA